MIRECGESYRVQNARICLIPPGYPAVGSLRLRNWTLGNLGQHRAGTAPAAGSMIKIHLRGNTVPANLRIPGRYYLAIFVLACATLSFQILITRFFSVMLYYHFAFAAISLAMARTD